MKRFARVCVFCGSSRGVRAAYHEAAAAAGTEFARRGIELVYGGGKVGLMGIAADAALASGGHVIGVIPEDLVAKEVGHTGLPDLRVVKTMHERKALMAELSDAFIALPGGVGTFEEFFEILTWAQLGLHSKPCGLLNINGFYDPLLRLLDHACSEKFLRPEHRSIVHVESDLATLLARMAEYKAPSRPKWIDRADI